MKKILFIGGEAPFLNELKRELAGKGHDVVIAYDRDDGLAMAKRERPDVIIIDIRKFHAADYALFKELRWNEQVRHTPIVASVPESFHEDERGDQLGGAAGLIEKPFDALALLARIEKLSHGMLSSGSEKTAPEFQRKHPRLKREIAIDFRLVNLPGEYRMGNALDLSSGGMKLEAVCAEQVPEKGQYLEMIIKGFRPGDEIKVLGQVMWVEHMRFTFGTKMGIKFIFFSDEDAGKVKKLIE